MVCFQLDEQVQATNAEAVGDGAEVENAGGEVPLEDTPAEEPVPEAPIITAASAARQRSADARDRQDIRQFHEVAQTSFEQNSRLMLTLERIVARGDGDQYVRHSMDAAAEVLQCLPPPMKFQAIDEVTALVSKYRDAAVRQGCFNTQYQLSGKLITF